MPTNCLIIQCIAEKPSDQPHTASLAPPLSHSQERNIVTIMVQPPQTIKTTPSLRGQQLSIKERRKGLKKFTNNNNCLLYVHTSGRRRIERREFQKVPPNKSQVPAPSPLKNKYLSSFYKQKTTPQYLEGSICDNPLPRIRNTASRTTCQMCTTSCSSPENSANVCHPQEQLSNYTHGKSI